MHLITLSIVLVLVIVLVISLFFISEGYTNYINKLDGLKPFDQTSLSSGVPVNNTYPKVIKSKPWNQPWCSSGNKMVCYLDSHLNRKCFWTCDDNQQRKYC